MSSTGAGYDLGTEIFSPDGRLFQVEYAAKAVENSGAALGIKCKDGVVMGVEKLLASKLLVEGSNRRVYTVDKHAGVAFAGYNADGRPLAKVAQSECANYYQNYGTEMPPHVLADRIGQYMHAHTTYGGYRPYGVSILVAGYDMRDKEAFLHMVEPSGVNFRYKGCAVGKSRQVAKTEIEKLKLDELTVKEGLNELARIVYLIHDDIKDKPFEFEASWVCAESNYQHQLVSKAERDAAVAWAKAKIEEDEMSDGDD